MSPFLLAGVVLGISVLLIFAFVFGRRGTEKTWRGYADAFGAGIVLGALFDLLPKALEFAGTLLASILRTQVLTPLQAPPDSFLAIGAGILAEAVTPFGALLVLFLYLSGNSAPMPVNGQIVGMRMPGWRVWFSIPGAGQVDWKGIAIVTFGLSAHNLWLGQVRGALAQAGDHVLTTFFFAFGLIATLRAFALVGSLVDVRARWLALSGCAILIGGTGVLGVTNPDTGKTIVLGIVPVFIAVLTLPIALGRLLRVMQYDIGLGWNATLDVLAGLGIERLMGYLFLMLVQGQLGLPQ
jgi:hypothetical protein